MEKDRLYNELQPKIDQAIEDLKEMQYLKKLHPFNRESISFSNDNNYYCRNDLISGLKS